ncbi:MAG: hydrogenase formation protein HypD [Campylobacterales bacterium]
MELKELNEGFRDPKVIISFKKKIDKATKELGLKPSIMEVCGGHTHVIAKYQLSTLLKDSIDFIHGPGCPVCVMPKERIDHAYTLAMQKDVILVTLGDMIKVPGSQGTLADARAKGADVRFVYSPLECLNIANKNQDKRVVFFAIGFETTTPMTASLLESLKKSEVNNLLFHINHVRVPEAIEAIISTDSKIDGFIGPSHVSVITGSKIYDFLPKKYKKPVAVSGFEPVDVLEGLLMIVEQLKADKPKVEIQYSRSVNEHGNSKALELMDKYFEQRDFKWRGIGVIPKSALKLKSEFAHLDAEVIYDDILPKKEIDDFKDCICGEILKGLKKPNDCKLFAKACTPKNPLGSCMVSSEGACAAYYKYLR